jgi:hypothetical protein
LCQEALRTHQMVTRGSAGIPDHAKRLPCGHVEHLHCLQELILHNNSQVPVKQLLCPECKAPVFEPLVFKQGARTTLTWQTPRSNLLSSSLLSYFYVTYYEYQALRPLESSNPSQTLGTLSVTLTLYNEATNAPFFSGIWTLDFQFEVSSGQVNCYAKVPVRKPVAGGFVDAYRGLVVPLDPIRRNHDTNHATVYTFTQHSAEEYILQTLLYMWGPKDTALQLYSADATYSLSPPPPKRNT